MMNSFEYTLLIRMKWMTYQTVASDIELINLSKFFSTNLDRHWCEGSHLIVTSSFT